MNSTSADAPPGCLVIAIALSATMAQDVRVRLAHREIEGKPDIRDLPAGFAARFLADELLDALVNTLSAGYPVPLDVAVIGYTADANGAISFTSLLQDGKPRVQLVPLAEIAALPIDSRSRPGDPRKWTVAPEYAGTAPATAAFVEIYRLASMWLIGRYRARPPVIIHCTDGVGIDESYARVARSFGLLATAYGPARLMHVGFTPVIESVLCGEWPESMTEPWASLAELSAELPAEPDGRPARRAVSVNDWSIADAWTAIFDHAPVPTIAFHETDAGRFSPTLRALWAQKMGNRPEEWEDAFATDPAMGVAVVADGASSGIYCRVWAEQLATRFIRDRPDARDPAALATWVNGLRTEWRAAIDYPTLSWTKQRKVDETGAAATLLTLEVGPLGEDGNRLWRAFAVGDACMFWVRDGKLLSSFPVVAAGHFGSAPLLVRSNPGHRTLAVTAAGVCRSGDRFILATDAVAARLLTSLATEPGPDWDAFETIDEGAWRLDLDSLRKTHEMVNDDCTLVALRIMGAEPEAIPEPIALEEESSLEATGE